MTQSSAAQQGVSLVELMVGLAIGLSVVSAGLLALAHHMRESRHLLEEARLQQDLRTATELIARDLRRAGPLTIDSAGTRFSHADSEIDIAYRLRAGAIEVQLGEGGWQALTDVNTLRVTLLRITPRMQEATLDGFCSRACSASDSSCPPRQTLRSIDILIEAQPARAATPRRVSTSTVRLRHDELRGACPDT